jgi:hypothetical protein
MKPLPLFRCAIALGAAGMTGAVISPAQPALETGGAPTTQIRYLSGTGADDAVPWDFFCTAGRNSGVWSKIRVPSCWEQEGFGTYQYGVVLRSKNNAPPLAAEQGRYRLRFDLPADWQGRMVRLVFDGSMTDTGAWLNGQPVGPVHQGAFYRFQYDVTRLLKFGEANLLEVTVSKESANASVNEAERRGDYWNFGGIFRPVYLEALPAQFIDRTAIDARADGSFRADVFLGAAAAAPGRVTAQVIDAAGAGVGAPAVASFVAGDDRVSLRTSVPAPDLWTAETPHLYRVRFTLAENGAPGHALTERFGFRTFEVRPRDGLYLNGRKITLKGVNRHSFWPESARTLSRRLNFDDVRLIREMNMNAVRMSHYPPDRDFLEACDELGLYVLDELGGWHGKYDTPTGQKLIREMLQRDVNHPGILFWDNGNEGGWNTDNDGEFAKWDPQRRAVLHPLGTFSQIATMHYRSYDETKEFLRGPEIFLPTEFLHGLYDGGHGAGLWDYWELMRQSPLSAGGFLWVYADEGVVRTDEKGRIDNAGNFAPDGIVGPHHEREGSFNTIREVWSPVHVGPEKLPDDFRGVLAVENRYDFTGLDQCKFAWALGRFPLPRDSRAGHTVVAGGEAFGPSIAPHLSGKLSLPLPEDWRDADVLYVTAKNPAGQALWTWSWSWEKIADGPDAAATGVKVQTREDDAQLIVSAGALELNFSKSTGELARVNRGGKTLSFGNGPRFYAVRRGDRQADGTVAPKVEKGVDRKYDDISGASTLTGLVARPDGASVIIEANYAGNLRQARWRISPDGEARLDYAYAFDGAVDMIGVGFDYPEAAMKSIRWLGMGPYRVWQNRLNGTTLDVWQNAYNDPTPGESFDYPEFKGYFHDWRWAVFETTEGRVTLTSEAPGSFLGVYTPRDGKDALLFTFPPSGIAVLDVIPPVRNKVNATDLIGPQSQPAHMSGVKHGAVRFRFEPRGP